MPLCQVPYDALVVNLDYDVLVHSSSFPHTAAIPDCLVGWTRSPADLTAPVLASFQSIQQSLLARMHAQNMQNIQNIQNIQNTQNTQNTQNAQNAGEWKERWSCPDPDHRLPKLNKQDSTVLFSTVLDLYGRLVSGYGYMLRAREGGNYAGCTLRDMFEVDGFVKGAPRALQPFLREFVATQLFSNLIRSRVECSCMTQGAAQTPFDFPVLFFDKYLALMKQPAKTRVSHLYRVLYQRSNRILLLSVSLENKESLRASSALSSSVSNEASCLDQSHFAALLKETWKECPSIQVCGHATDSMREALTLPSEPKALPEELQFCCCHVWCASCRCSVDLAVMAGRGNDG